MYQHLTDFNEIGARKILSIFSWSNVGGAVAGMVLSWFIGPALPLPGWLTWGLLVAGGVALTWPHEDQPLYRLVALWTRFHLAQVFTPAQVEARHYFTLPA